MSETPGVPDAAAEILADGTYCATAVRGPGGPHVTPLVFVYSGGRLWVTTSRDSVKAKAWRADERVAGLVRSQDGQRAATLTGVARLHDALSPGTWLGSVRSAPRIAAATADFTRKNARFFAGYARDAHKVPFAWTPPGRVFVEIEIEAGAVVDEEAGSVLRWGRWRQGFDAAPTFRATKPSSGALDAVPRDVVAAIGSSGSGALSVASGHRLVVLPVGWSLADGALYVAAPEAVVQLAAVARESHVGLAVDHSSSWRAGEMTGVLVQGRARGYALARLRSGTSSAAERVRGSGVDPGDAALLRIEPSRLVWWHGWSSGTVKV